MEQLHELYPFVYVLRAGMNCGKFFNNSQSHDVCCFSTKALADAAVNHGNSSPGSLIWNYSVYVKQSIDVSDQLLSNIDQIPSSFPYDD